MGHSTRYTFTRIDGDVMKFRDAFNASKHARDDGYRFPGIAGEHGDEWKWYEHEAHIAEAMLVSETDGIDLHGVGESNGDIWDKEFRRQPDSFGEPEVKVSVFKFEIKRPVKPTETKTIKKA